MPLSLNTLSFATIGNGDVSFLSSLSILSPILFLFMISLSFLAPIRDGVASNSFVSLISCSYNDGVMFSFYFLSLNYFVTPIFSSFITTTMTSHPLSIVSLSTLSSFFFLSPFTFAVMAPHPFSILSFSTLLFLLFLSSLTLVAMASHPFFTFSFSTISSFPYLSRLLHLLALGIRLFPLSTVFEFRACLLLAMTIIAPSPLSTIFRAWNFKLAFYL